MSKPSTTNCPKTFVWGDTFRCWLCICDTVCLCAIVNLYRLYVIRLRELSGGYCGGVPPLPIPNREVKPTCADGTAMQCGRVGSRLLFSSKPQVSKDSWGFLLVVYLHRISFLLILLCGFVEFVVWYLSVILSVILFIEVAWLTSMNCVIKCLRI